MILQKTLSREKVGRKPIPLSILLLKLKQKICPTLTDSSGNGFHHGKSKNKNEMKKMKPAKPWKLTRQHLPLFLQSSTSLRYELNYWVAQLK